MKSRVICTVEVCEDGSVRVGMLDGMTPEMLTELACTVAQHAVRFGANPEDVAARVGERREPIRSTLGPAPYIVGVG